MLKIVNYKVVFFGFLCWNEDNLYLCNVFINKCINTI